MNEKMKNIILMFINSQKFIEELELEKVREKESMEDVANFLEEQGAKILLDEIDHNGWEYDIWLPFMYKNNRFAIEFKAYYNVMTLFMEDQYD